MQHHNSQHKVKGEDFTNKDLSKKEFQDYTFEQCDFSYANLSHANLQNVTFIACNLSCVNLQNARIQQINFANCKLVGVDFHVCSTSLGGLQLQFSHCLLNGCNFSDLKLAKTNFLHSQMESCIFTNADLSESDFSNTDLLNTLFHGCKLIKANFTSAKNYMIDPGSNVITKAKFSLPDAVSLLKFLDIELQ